MPVMIGFVFSMLLGWLGLGLIVSIAAGCAYWLIPEVPWLTDKLRQLLLIVCICSGTCTFVYAKGVYDGSSAYKARLARQIDKAVTKGETARENILREFDKSTEVPDDGFARD